MKKFLNVALWLMLAATLGLAGCDNDGPVEDAAEEVEEAADEVEDEVDDAT